MRALFLLLFPSLLTGLAILSACDSPPSAAPPTNAPAAPASQLIFADGWTRVELFANSAHTNLDAGAHFDTDRNKCGFDASGALDLKTWNPIATDVNAFLHSTRLNDEKCRDLPGQPDPKFKFDGTADLVTQDGNKVILFEYRNWSVCSLIQDDALYQRLLTAINDLVLAADKEDATCGW